MSNRSLIEINHDFSHLIEHDSEAFLLALGRYLRSGSTRNAVELERWGVRVFGMRHHTEGFDIKWGSNPSIADRAIILQSR